MINALRRTPLGRIWIYGIACVALLGTAYASAHASLRWLALLLAGTGAVILLNTPILGFFILVPATMLLPLEFGTGTDVSINITTLLVPALLGIWLLGRIRQRDLSFVPSRVNKPLLIFLLAGLLSLVIGNALWDPAVPMPNNLALIQLAQWAIFAFSAGAFWWIGNVLRSERDLRRLTLFYLAVAGSLAILYVLTNGTGLVYLATTIVFQRAPFWMLLGAIACGQLLFNPELSRVWRVFLVATLAASIVYCFFLQRARSSNWVGLGAAIGILVWLRWPRWRPLLAMLAIVGLVGFAPHVYEFAGGDDKWDDSGGSRLVLIGRVVEVTMRNPITGLGPAAYRAYARMRPLLYQIGGTINVYWVDPQINSHNNYVDLFAHMGALGLAIFFWFAVELILFGLRLRARFTEGFAAGYVNAMIAAWVAALVIMALADWILPHVYNIGFPGFQASVLVWLFLGGLLTLERVSRDVKSAAFDET